MKAVFSDVPLGNGKGRVGYRLRLTHMVGRS
jgi:hypothetical protein